MDDYEARHARPSEESESRSLIPLQVRRWLYGITTAAVPLLVAYGIIDEAVAPLWVGLAMQVLATATAFANTPAQEGGSEWHG